MGQKQAVAFAASAKEFGIFTFYTTFIVPNFCSHPMMKKMRTKITTMKTKKEKSNNNNKKAKLLLLLNLGLESKVAKYEEKI